VLELMGIRPRRAERGDVRYLILDAIAAQPRHGYEIIQAIEQRTGGRYKPSPGTVYPTLQMLEEMGHARSREEGGRKVFEITDEGRRDLQEHRDEVEDAYDRLGETMDWVDPAEFHQLVRRIRRLMHGVGRALHRGRLGPSQLDAIRSAIEEAATKIEATLKPEREP
jgi:DNA-binding PadR family transcriptional regulator